MESGSIKELYKDRIAIWEALSQEIRFENRFFYKKSFNFQIIKKIIPHLSIEIGRNEKFFRARISPDKDCFKAKEMGCPPAHKSANGRANPPGIPYLYLASSEDVAVYEVKPSMMDYVSVGQFIVKKDFRCVDFRYISPFQFHDSEVDYETAVKYVGMLTEMGKNLENIINHRTTHYEYVPTQYVCEMIKSFGFSGVIYNSSSEQGFNLTLFGDSDVKCEKVTVKTISKIQYTTQRP